MERRMTPQQFFTALGFIMGDAGGCDAFVTRAFDCAEPYLLFTATDDCDSPRAGTTP
jgi:hypothetical protein